MAVRITEHDRIIAAIGKEIGAKDFIVYLPIRIDEAAGFGVIVTGIEIVEIALGIVVIAAVTERIEVGDVGGVG